MDQDKKHKSKHKVYMEHSEHKKHKTYATAAWAFGIIALILAIALVVSFLMKPSISATTGISEDELRTKTMAYLAKMLPGQAVSIDSIKDEGDMYSLKLNVAGRIYDSYARKDGSFLFPSGIDMNQPIEAAAPTPTQPENIPKTDKPVVELFVMSHCPYGTQSEKGILPAAKTLGDKVDFKIRFVYYAMHGEKEIKEQLTQYCIQKEQNTKYLPYLACFLNDTAGQGSATASDACIASLNIDKTALESCKTASDEEFSIMKSFNDQASWLSGRFPLFNTDKALNEKYAVQGSPTLVINGVQSNAGRDSASYLAAICNAMNTPSAECQTQLSAVSPGPGFGYDSTAAATAAGCGV
ncbi:TPA: hypothetical protein HA235_02765 [Candidatus Woesearchaeota archaeon]|nr:hypothetical protein [Candidatus Woesearchaeota archaeon]HIH55258.1 hypothetical protein [Candidatus Woesearchaeota archaeon]HIJ02407.1 hypothetical protein [Candidatus Woesearchaeota archaeon]HIJ13318.1 hypothetical protein [Candidatus Woesearchaeota archaeon]